MRSARIGLNAKALENVPAKGSVDTILELPNEGGEENPNGDKPTNQTCVSCKVNLSEDEVTINQRFIDHALQEINA